MLLPRDLIPFPNGRNSSDTAIHDVHFNLTTLREWNYTLYTNGTLSNGSRCYLTPPPYTPVELLSNGTFINATSCYEPVDPIGSRAAAGVAFAVAYGLCLIGILVNLNKHGRLHLPAEKRFRPVGRRWQWYWAIWVVATAFVSLFTTVDVDRFRVVGLPIILTSFFWFLMQQGALALAWEAVRHWGSWQERQFVDPNPFILPDHDRRSRVEFWLPLWFYLWLWLNFFLVFPRNWGQIQLQRDPDQAAARAAPAATDARFKAASFCLLVCWLTVVFSLRHSLRHYKPRNRGWVNKARGLFRSTPLRFRLILPLALVIVGFQVFVSFSFPNSILNAGGNLASIYAGGYGPTLLILVIQIVWGLRTPNEDKELVRQRRRRGEQMDREMGVVRKPAWWRRVNASWQHDPSDIPGGNGNGNGYHQSNNTIGTADAGADSPVVARQDSRAGLVAMSKESVPTTTPSAAYAGKSERRRVERVRNAAAAGVLFPSPEGRAAELEAQAARRAEAMREGPAPPPFPSDFPRLREPQTATDVSGAVERTTPGNETVTPPAAVHPMRVRSMLDI
ncbi:hypothetical protein SODALDRAFT_333589 [Sodiomyces alkalinus F11]|uniref:DUF2434 domain-containing protein n=1 Tax=Sodiomyces alkalinus (strain CBS 110278 / VKM F-3762 / F11) TaxID=1314773 RepID=A0A3N2PTL5_SODAK|nr:hypothetical protein SODALDRAFT_333589 [Sodiomyces alkalinus F11]ROT37838.1 hypothetical protein SODALDRAFT_333589 [Sodiomyces alkalinus F11]